MPDQLSACHTPALAQSRGHVITAHTAQRAATRRLQEALRTHLAALLHDVWPPASGVEVAFPSVDDYGHHDYTDGRLRAVYHRPVAVDVPLIDTTADGAPITDLATDDIALPDEVDHARWSAVCGDLDTTLALLLRHGLPAGPGDAFLSPEEDHLLFLDLAPVSAKE